MTKPYLTEKNISKKADKWLSTLNISNYRTNQLKFNLEKSALLVIDMQNFFLNDKSHAFLPAAKAIIPKINSIIKKFRKRNYTIIFTYHAYKIDENPGIMGRWWGDVLRINNPLSRIHPLIDWNKNDITLRKSRYSAFIGTKLEKILKEKKVNTLVVTGIMTHLCCESTAREAFMKDYNVFFVVDATATDTEPLHISSLLTLSDGFVIPVKTDTILKEVNNIA